MNMASFLELLPFWHGKIALELYGPELSVIGEVVGCRLDFVSLVRSMSTKKLLIPIQPTKRIDRAIICWEVELVDAEHAGT